MVKRRFVQIIYDTVGAKKTQEMEQSFVGKTLVEVTDGLVSDKI